MQKEAWHTQNLKVNCHTHSSHAKKGKGVDKVTGEEVLVWQAASPPDDEVLLPGPDQCVPPVHAACRAMHHAQCTTVHHGAAQNSTCAHPKRRARSPGVGIMSGRAGARLTQTCRADGSVRSVRSV